MTVTTLPRLDTSASDASVVALSVVIPLRDEAESLRQLYAELSDALAALDLGDYELIFIDDGSTDDSAAILAELYQADRSVQVIQFRRNFGKSAALSAGFQAAAGDYVVTLDADLQDVPAELPKLLAPVVADEFDLVSGWKTPRHDPLTKTLPSALFNRVVRWATGIKLHDFNCGFKAYRREVVEEVRLYGELHRYIPVLAHFRGFRVGEIPVQHRPRRHGRSKFGLERYFRGFFDLLTVLFLNHYTRRPLHLFGWLGLLAFGTGFLIDAYLAVLKLGFGEPIGHRPLLTFGVLLMVIGALFVVFGLLGEMIAYQTRLILGDDGGRIDFSIRKVLRHDRSADD
jgi:glycosyltransferase involved in cell wall biosynthesis